MTRATTARQECGFGEGNKDNVMMELFRAYFFECSRLIERSLFCLGRYLVLSLFCIPCLVMSSLAQSTPMKVDSEVQKIIIDTDIGGDIDDAFAVGLALQSPEFRILGICSATGDTTLRARLISRMLKETGRTDIPVAVGIAKPDVKHDAGLSQAAYAEGGPTDRKYPGAVDFLLEQIRRQPGEITLIA